MTVRVVTLWSGLALIFAVITGLVLHKERVLREGEPLLLRLGVADPRSLIEGDYMSLRYTVRLDDAWPKDGRVLLRRGVDNVGELVGLYRPGDPIGPGELTLRYRRRGRGVRLGAEAFYFQEGTAARYASAAYAELRVAPSGESVLIGLRDAGRKPIQ
jgi:uncharacterized membrane-anchored protein